MKKIFAVFMFICLQATPPVEVLVEPAITINDIDAQIHQYMQSKIDNAFNKFKESREYFKYLAIEQNIPLVNEENARIREYLRDTVLISKLLAKIFPESVFVLADLNHFFRSDAQLNNPQEALQMCIDEVAKYSYFNALLRVKCIQILQMKLLENVGQLYAKLTESMPEVRTLDAKVNHRQALEFFQKNASAINRMEHVIAFLEWKKTYEMYGDAVNAIYAEYPLVEVAVVEIMISYHHEGAPLTVDNLKLLQAQINAQINRDKFAGAPLTQENLAQLQANLSVVQ